MSTNVRERRHDKTGYDLTVDAASVDQARNRALEYLSAKGHLVQDGKGEFSWPPAKGEVYYRAYVAEKNWMGMQGVYDVFAPKDKVNAAQITDPDEDYDYGYDNDKYESEYDQDGYELEGFGNSIKLIVKRIKRALLGPQTVARKKEVAALRAEHRRMLAAAGKPKTKAKKAVGAAAKRRKTTTKPSSTTRMATATKPKKRTPAAKKKAAPKTAVAARRRRTTTASQPPIKKTGVNYPYKKVALRSEWEAKGFGIDKQISRSAAIVRKGGPAAKAEAAWLRRQSVADKKARMRRGALAGTPTKAKRASTRKVGAAKRNPNWKPTAAQKASLSPAMLLGLRKYHTGR